MFNAGEEMALFSCVELLEFLDTASRDQMRDSCFVRPLSKSHPRKTDKTDTHP